MSNHGSKKPLNWSNLVTKEEPVTKSKVNPDTHYRNGTPPTIRGAYNGVIPKTRPNPWMTDQGPELVVKGDPLVNKDTDKQKQGNNPQIPGFNSSEGAGATAAGSQEGQDPSSDLTTQADDQTIGETTSNQPVMDDPFDPAHNDFDSDDHQEAAQAHNDADDAMDPQESMEHQQNAGIHEDLAQDAMAPSERAQQNMMGSAATGDFGPDSVPQENQTPNPNNPNMMPPGAQSNFPGNMDPDTGYLFEQFLQLLVNAGALRNGPKPGMMEVSNGNNPPPTSDPMMMGPTPGSSTTQDPMGAPGVPPGGTSTPHPMSLNFDDDSDDGMSQDQDFDDSDGFDTDGDGSDVDDFSDYPDDDEDMQNDSDSQDTGFGDQDTEKEEGFIPPPKDDNSTKKAIDCLSILFGK